MKPRPTIEISELRKIGWTYWDPIGLRDMIGDDYNEGPVDEYDGYLMAAFGKLCNGSSELEVSIYLDDIASNHMGLGPTNEGGASAKKTVAKLADLVKSLI